MRSLGLVLLAGCAAKEPPSGMPDLAMDPLIVARPYEHRAPSTLDAAKPAPVILLLHGRGINGFFIDAFYGLGRIVDAEGFIYAFPDGTKDKNGSSRWNHADEPGAPDDVAYLDAVLADLSARYRIDPARVYVTGHSNGAAMAQRYACARPDRVAAIAPFAGTFALDEKGCTGSTRLSVLMVCGDQDPAYTGPPPLRANAEGWAKRAGCAQATETLPAKLDLDRAVAGEETVAERFTGCPAGLAVELWTLRGSVHSPSLTTSFAPAIWGFLKAHPRR